MCGNGKDCSSKSSSDGSSSKTSEESSVLSLRLMNLLDEDSHNTVSVSSLSTDSDVSGSEEDLTAELDGLKTQTLPDFSEDSLVLSFHSPPLNLSYYCDRESPMSEGGVKRKRDEEETENVETEKAEVVFLQI